MSDANSSQLDRLLQDIYLLQTENQDLIAQLNKKASPDSQELVSLRKEKLQLQKELAEVKHHLKQTQAHQSSSSVSSEELTQWQKKVEELTQELKTQQNRISQLESEKETIKSQLTQQLSQQSNQLTQLTQENQKLKSQASTNSTATTTTTTAPPASAPSGSINEQIQALQKKNEKLEKQAKQGYQYFTEMEKKIKKLEISNRELRSQGGQDPEVVEKLEERIEELEGINRELTKSKPVISSSEEIQNLNTQILQLTSKCEMYDKKVMDYKRQNDELRKAHQSPTSNAGEVQKLQDQLQIVRQQLSQAQQELSKPDLPPPEMLQLQQQNRELRAQLAQMATSSSVPAPSPPVSSVADQQKIQMLVQQVAQLTQENQTLRMAPPVPAPVIPTGVPMNDTMIHAQIQQLEKEKTEMKKKIEELEDVKRLSINQQRVMKEIVKDLEQKNSELMNSELTNQKASTNTGKMHPAHENNQVQTLREQVKRLTQENKKLQEAQSQAPPPMFDSPIPQPNPEYSPKDPSTNKRIQKLEKLNDELSQRNKYVQHHYTLMKHKLRDLEALHKKSKKGEVDLAKYHKLEEKVRDLKKSNHELQTRNTVANQECAEYKHKYQKALRQYTQMEEENSSVKEELASYSQMLTRRQKLLLNKKSRSAMI